MAAIVAAIGLKLEDLFPPRPLKADRTPGERRPFFPADVFAIARSEIGVVAILAADMSKQRAISRRDFDRLLTAVSRLSAISEAAYGRQ